MVFVIPATVTFGMGWANLGSSIMTGEETKLNLAISDGKRKGNEGQTGQESGIEDSF